MQSAFIVSFTLVCVLCLTCPALSAQDSPRAEDDGAAATTLQLLRIGHERSLIEASLAPLKKQFSELAAAEQARAAARDYVGAIEARDMRKRLEYELERLDKELLLLQTREQTLKASLLPERISLPLDSAILNGVSRINGELTQWSRPGASAVWMLPGLPPGGYEVLLRYRCGALEGGSVVLQEKKFTLGAEIDTTLKGAQEKNLGTLKITDGSGPLTITARTVVKDNLMHLLAVELIPAAR